MSTYHCSNCGFRTEDFHVMKSHVFDNHKASPLVIPVIKLGAVQILCIGDPTTILSLRGGAYVDA